MPEDDPRPILGLTGVEAGGILGVTHLTVSQLVANGVLPKAVRYQHRGLGRATSSASPSSGEAPGRPYWASERGVDGTHLLGGSSSAT